MARWLILASAVLASLSGAAAFVSPSNAVAAPSRAPRTIRGVVRMGKMAKVSCVDQPPRAAPLP
jgi:hypothetical protein